MFTALSEQLTGVLRRLKGSGRPVQEVNRLLGQFEQMRTFWKRM